MVKESYLKHSFFFLSLIFSGVIFLSCGTTESQTETGVQPKVETPVAFPADRTVTPTPHPASEYARSVAEFGGAISEDTFRADKAAIMKIISDLEKIMNATDTPQWRKYLSPSSTLYLRNAANLRIVSSKLPPQLILRNDEDYFKFVFIPARQGRKIDEIRYESATKVKAVQMIGNKDVVYYFFEKIDGRWLVTIDESHT
ncbi:MAG: hypothetical protein Pg6C_14380 [Treponemataceae bacterium]|nr:MAG: hypothetical protein Pg6C_14380 [Treponemataceae bacterium]